MKETTLEIFTPDFSTHVELPVMAGTVQAGFPSPAENYAEQSLDLNRLMIRNPASTFIARAKSDSMIGDGITDADLLIVDKAAEIRNGCLAVCVVEGVFTRCVEVIAICQPDHGGSSLFGSEPTVERFTFSPTTYDQTCRRQDETECTMKNMGGRVTEKSIISRLPLDSGSRSPYG